MTFKATSFVVLLRFFCVGLGEGERERRRSEEAKVKFDFEGFNVGPGVSLSATAPRSAVAIWSTGTCHVARYRNEDT